MTVTPIMKIAYLSRLVDQGSLPRADGRTREGKIQRSLIDRGFAGLSHAGTVEPTEKGRKSQELMG